MSGYHDTGDVTAAARAVEQLNKQADEIRADIVRSRRELEQLQRDYGSTRAAQLVEANEQLVLAALQAETLAEQQRLRRYYLKLREEHRKAPPAPAPSEEEPPA